LTVTLIGDPEAFIIPASVVVSTPEVPNGNDDEPTLAAPEIADFTPPADDVVVDPVPVEADTLGTEIVGMLGVEVVVFGIVTVGTLTCGAEICETLGKNGIEL
jgi:hypothetical protein